MHRTAIRWIGVSLVMALFVIRIACTRPGFGRSNPGAITLTAGFDFANAYFFRGIPQDDTGPSCGPPATWALRSSRATVRSRVSVSTSGRGTACTREVPAVTARAASCGQNPISTRSASLGFGKGTALGVTYTAYTSPNGLFGTVKELSFKLTVDDSRL